MEKRYTLSPQYIPYTDRIVGGMRLHSFQASLADIDGMEDDCLLIRAPTGAGKTFGFCLPTECSHPGPSGRGKTLVISPTNALIQQTSKDIVKQSEEDGFNLTVDSFSAKEFLSRGYRKTMEMYDRISKSDMIVTNPDILTLLVAGYYIKDFKANSRIRQWSTIFRSISTLIFDEYHLYSEEELGKILSFILLSKGTGNDHIKFAFSSATPQDKLKDVLNRHGISFSEVVQDIEGIERGMDEQRTFKGRLELIFTDQPMLDSLFDEIPSKSRTLFLFDRVVDCQRSIDILQENHVSDICEISGFQTRSSEQRSTTGKEAYVIATSAAEQGLNMEVPRAHIEPGRYIENFWQRLGRTARRGKDGIIFVHVSTPMLNQLPESIDDHYSLADAVEGLMDSRDLYSTWLHNHAGAFLYLVWSRCKNPALRGQVWDVGREFRTFNQFHAMNVAVRDLEQEGADLGWPATEEASRFSDWWRGYVDSFGWFRGQSTSVKVTLPREGAPSTEADLIWLKRNCEFEICDDGEGGHLYRINRFIDSPREVTIRYPLPSSFLEIEYRCLMNRSCLIRMWEEGIKTFIQGAFSDAEELNDSVSRILTMLPLVLKSMRSNLIKPEGVDESVASNFL